MNSKGKRIRKKEGVLQVKLSSRSALGKAWKRKWVVVQQNTSSSGKSLLLELYVEKGAYHKTVTSLLLEGVVSVKRTRSKTQEHAIEISSNSKVLLGVGAESETDAQEWLSMFRMNLLPPVKEMQCPPGIPEDFVRLSVVPNKDSERAHLSGDYYAHISLTHINLYDTNTGKIDLDWDLRHLKKFMLISKCHQLDFEKIVHIMTSKRSVSGEGEFIFYSSKGKELVESLYERLSNAMTVKSRRSRSTSMLFEITALELEQMFKDADQPPEETLQEDERGEAEAKGETDGAVNGSAPEDVPVSNGVKANGQEAPKEVVEQTPAEKQEDGVEVIAKQDEQQSDETRDDVTQNQEEVTQNQEEVTQNQEEVTQNQEEVTQNEVEVTQNQEEVTQNQEEVCQNQEAENRNQAEATQNQEEVTQTREETTQNQEKVTQNQEEVTQSQEVVTQGQEEVAAEINEKTDVAIEVIMDEEAITEASDTNVTDVEQQLDSVSSQHEDNPNGRLAEDAQEDDKCNQTNPDEMDLGVQASTGPTEEQAVPPETSVNSDTHGPKELEVSLTQVNEQCVTIDQHESTTDDGAGKEQSTDLKDSSVQDGQSQLSSTVGDVEESFTIVPTSEKTQETANIDKNQPTTTSAAIAQESAEHRDDETRLDEEKSEVQPDAVNVPASKDQKELTETDTEHQQVLAKPAITDVEVVVTKPVNVDVEQVTEAETEQIAITEEHSSKNRQRVPEVTEEQTSNKAGETEVVDAERGTKPEELSDSGKQEAPLGDQELDTTPVTVSVNTDGEPESSTVSNKEHVTTLEVKTNEASSEETAPAIVHEHNPPSDEPPKYSEADVAVTAVGDVTPEVSRTDVVPSQSEGTKPSTTETSTREVSSENIPDGQTKSGTESSSESPRQIPAVGEETREDELNSNQNNSNSDATGVRKISKTIPLPNSLTSRMASALRNAQKRKVSSSCPPSQETQTEFLSSESQPSDDTPEIIV
ncbi:dentin sialophosphoprotein-like isoform X2 [Asterias rubens]|uniref:dentin sialophosphoprotein-like isoform X2 n=1 Tax=Asterias rubens TaxID=7604 RepID=UPI00145582D7|nr:dentin sialophosphoprotein-like isoform X2 [Asterias rubens]